LIFANSSLCKSFMNKIVLCAFIHYVAISLIFSELGSVNNVNGLTESRTEVPFIGVDMKGLYTSTVHSKRSDLFFPDNYYNDSFKLIAGAGINHIRYVPVSYTH
jgi:hypothetical protein